MKTRQEMCDAFSPFQVGATKSAAQHTWQQSKQHTERITDLEILCMLHVIYMHK